MSSSEVRSSAVKHSPKIDNGTVENSYVTEYLYTTHYRRKLDGALEDAEHGGNCALCGASKSPMALLLNMPDPDLRTECLPPPGSLAKLAFPLAMGNFPETDIISASVCCDPCSHFITRVGEAPPNEKIVAAVILTSLEYNWSHWILALTSALEHRFDDQDLGLLFLAICILPCKMLIHLTRDLRKR